MDASCPRFRLATLLVWVAFLAVVCAALVKPSIWWVAVLWFSILCFSGGSIALAWAGQGGERVQWGTMGVVSALALALTRWDRTGMHALPFIRTAMDLRSVSVDVEQDVMLTAAVIYYATVPFVALLAGYFWRWVWERRSAAG